MSRKFARPNKKRRKPKVRPSPEACACFKVNKHLNLRALAFQLRRKTPPMTVEDVAEVLGCNRECALRKEAA